MSVSPASPRLGPTAFTHCALHVTDLAASIAFYRRYCGLEIVLEHGSDSEKAVWMAPATERRERPAFVLVLVAGGRAHEQSRGDITHYGFAVRERKDIDDIAEIARREGRLQWEPQDLGEPAGYLCAVRDPSGYVIEFSYGQPLGPGSEQRFIRGGAPR